MTRMDALEYFREELKDGKCSDTCPICNAMEWAIKALEQPEIVRCKDCKWASYDCEWCLNPDSGVCGDDATHLYIEPNWYCADGKRKEKTDEV